MTNALTLRHMTRLYLTFSEHCDEPAWSGSRSHLAGIQLESDPTNANPKHPFHTNHFHQLKCFAKLIFLQSISRLRCNVWVLTCCDASAIAGEIMFALFLFFISFHSWERFSGKQTKRTRRMSMHVGEFRTTLSPPGRRTNEATKSSYILLNTQRKISYVYTVKKTDSTQLDTHRQRKYSWIESADQPQGHKIRDTCSAAPNTDFPRFSCRQAKLWEIF